MTTIIENGEQFDLSLKEFKKIEHLVYKSGDGDIYHVTEDKVSEFLQLVLFIGLKDALDFENELSE